MRFFNSNKYPDSLHYNHYSCCNYYSHYIPRRSSREYWLYFRRSGYQQRDPAAVAVAAVVATAVQATDNTGPSGNNPIHTVHSKRSGLYHHQSIL